MERHPRNVGTGKFLIKMTPQIGALFQRAQEFSGDCQVGSSIPKHLAEAEHKVGSLTKN